MDDLGQSALAVAGDRDRVTLLVEQAAEHGAEVRVTLDEEQPRPRFHLATCGGGPRGPGVTSLATDHVSGDAIAGRGRPPRVVPGCNRAR